MFLMIAQQDIRHPWHTNFRRESGLELVQLSTLHCQVRKEFTKYFWALVSPHSASRSSVQTGLLSGHKQETTSFLTQHLYLCPALQLCAFVLSAFTGTGVQLQLYQLSNQLLNFAEAAVL